MKQIGRFTELANNPTMRATVDPNGSTVDKIFAEAIMASMPTLVTEKYGLAMIKDAPEQKDTISFPIYKNFDLTWNNISGTGSDTGSAITLTAGGSATYKEITPVLYSAGIFVSDVVDLTVNKADFDQYAQMAGVQVQKKIDTTVISALDGMDTDANSNRYAAGGFTVNGSIASASTLTPSDLSEAKRLLATGSDIYVPDVALMHPNQYTQLSLHQDFSLTSSTGTARKATFTNGEITGYDGMAIVVTELVDSHTTGGGSNLEWVVVGHPVMVFKKGMSVALGTKKAGFKVATVDDRIRHGKFKVFDVMLASSVLLPESIVLLRCAD